MDSLVSKEIAEKEVNSWLEYKKVSDKKRKSLAGNIKALIDAIQDGTLELDSDSKVFTHKLKFPIGVNGQYNELKYSPRISMESLEDNLIDVRPGNTMGTSIAYIAALSGQPKSIIKKMDQEDHSLADRFSFFFME